MNCVQWFRKSYPDVLAFHVPNGEWRHQHTADTLQRMGVKRGVFDWLVFTREHDFAIEFKSDVGELSEDQEHFNVQWTALGKGIATARTLEDFQAICIGTLGELQTPYNPSAPLEIDEAAVRAMMLTAPPKMPWET